MTLTHILPGILTTWATTGRPPRGDHEYVLWQIGSCPPAYAPLAGAPTQAHTVAAARTATGPKSNAPTGPATTSTAPANGSSSDAGSCTTSPCALEC
jgi:hypothetical protein